MLTRRLICAAGLFLFAMSALAQEHEGGEEESHLSHFHPNHVALFVGVTSEFKDDKDIHSTIGLDYIRRFGPTGSWGAGGFFEAIFKDHLEGLLGAHVYFYPTNSLWVMAGSGVEFHMEESHGDPADSEDDSSNKRETGFLFRTGVGYNFDLGGITLGPAVFLDTVRETASLVWGISIGRGF